VEPVEVLNEAAMMKAVGKLMNHENFQRIDHKGFNLLVDFGDEILEELNLIAQEHEGSVVYEPEVVKEGTEEDLQALFEKMGKGI
jgi:tRNA A37 threonylcarbamoyladenosine dehydratase